MKRFIAGAICPSCSAMDKIYVVMLAGIKWQKCAACEYQIDANDQTESPIEDGSQAVKIIALKGFVS